MVVDVQMVYSENQEIYGSWCVTNSNICSKSVHLNHKKEIPETKVSGLHEPEIPM